MFSRFVYTFFCLFFPFWLTAQTSSDDLTTIRRNYLQAILLTDTTTNALVNQLSRLQPEKEISDQAVVELHQKYPLDLSKIAAYLKQMDDQGAWPDINYSDTKRSGWEPKLHAERILELTKLYHTPSCSSSDNAILFSENSTSSFDTSTSSCTSFSPASDTTHLPFTPTSKSFDNMSTSSDNPYYHSAQLEASIHKALGYWLRTRPVCKNWWYNQIGVPKTFGRAFLLFQNQLTEEEKEGAIQIMQQASFGMTGQNKVWLAGNVLMRGLLQDDWVLVKAARDSIFSELTTGKAEGIQKDWSFHQHGPQQQFGNYGLSYLSEMSFFSNVFAGTSLALSESQQEILTSFLLEGYRWVIWQGYMDVNALDRQLFHNAQLHKAFSIAFAGQALLNNNTPKQIREINKFLSDNFLSKNYFSANLLLGSSDTPHSLETSALQEGKPVRRDDPIFAETPGASTISNRQYNPGRYAIPDSYDNGSSSYKDSIDLYPYNSFQGHKHFQESDQTVHRSSTWMASVKMASTRVIGTELINEDNLKGYYMADGATYIYQRGDEYLNIFPLWDWRKIPGITSYNTSAPIPTSNGPQSRNQSAFVGGVTDGQVGMTAMMMNREGLKAHKSWVFTDQFIVCLGAGIQTDSNLVVTTSVDQRLQRGNLLSIPSSPEQRFYHDHTGYIFLQPTACSAQILKRSGQWHDFMGMYQPAPVQGNLMSLYINHGLKPNNGSYSYLVLPSTTVETTAKFPASSIHILHNDTIQQSLSLFDGQLFFITAYSPCSLRLNSAFVFEALSPGIYQIRLQDKKLFIHGTDPTHLLPQLNIRINHQTFNLSPTAFQSPGESYFITTE